MLRLAAAVAGAALTLAGVALLSGLPAAMVVAGAALAAWGLLTDGGES